MERITYAGDSILTGTRISRAVLSYANALAHRGTSTTIDIPVRRPDGSVGRANMLIGPSSQLIAEEEESEFDELEDVELVEHLERDTVRLGSGGIVAGEASEFVDFDEISGLDYPDL